MPWRAVMLLGIAVLAACGNWLYSTRVNPEIKFWKHADGVKRAWVAGLGEGGEPRRLILGGSSAAFSVDGERIGDRYGLAVANLGMHAGMGPVFHASYAASLASRGDELVVAIEPDLLRSRLTRTQLADEIAVTLGDRGLASGEIMLGESFFDEAPGLLRPGARHVFTMLAKVMTRQPLYRYRPEDVRASGYQVTAVRDPALRGLPAGSDSLSADGRRLLLALREWGRAQGVTVRYSLPWAYVEPHEVAAARRANARFLLRVEQIIPVYKDSFLGAVPDKRYFADTPWHLTEEGAALRSDSLGAEMRGERIWSRRELAGRAAEQVLARTDTPEGSS